MGSQRDDELARTATAPRPSSSGADCPVEPAGTTLGRYRLEHELGAGGMGVVYAAFDPDLERRIALKVLRVAAPSIDAKDRLMREARAMARLSHSNVITVHEVGTANGRDFVAMELVHGGSLAEWLRASKRTAAAIIEAFVAAGRGLAAAHAAGIVHRDFKPHNVLRSREGRIVVTDFGLAREAEGAVSVALDMTLPIGATITVATSTPSSLAGLTVTGALLGTPAYMAPEQWRGGAVTHATDQFAYCVALWEALTGERPYRGPTLDDLRSQVASGPAALDASRMPRRIRAILRRGLDPDPARRWPNMDALLARLVRAERRPGVAVGIVGGAAIAGAVAVVALRSGGARLPACPSPAREIATVWSPAIAADVRTRTSDAHAAVLDTAFRAWQVTRARACSAPPEVLQTQLQCLDGVLGRFDALRQGYARVPGAAAEDIQAELIDPELCRKSAAADVPRLALTPTPDVVAAYELLGRAQSEDKPSDDDIAALAGKPTADPCARVIAIRAFGEASKDFPRVRTFMSDAESIVDQCGDERLRANLLIDVSPYHWELPMIGPRGEAAIKRAELAAKRVMQPDLEAALALQRVPIARQQAHWDEALALAERAIAGFATRGLQMRQLQAVTALNTSRLLRAEPRDLDAVIADTTHWRPIADANHKSELVNRLDIASAYARFWRGELAGGHADLLRIWQKASRKPTGPSKRIEGQVVDTRGRPVAGATVTSASVLGADSIGLGLPIAELDDSLRLATTDGAGRFEIRDAAPVGVLAAQLAERRSRPAAIADHVRLVLEPTRTVSGKVDLGKTPSGHLLVTCDDPDEHTGRFHLIAPVAPDGSFSLSGVSVGPIRIGVSVQGSLGLGEDVQFESRPASPRPITDLRLTTAISNRVLDVIVRSAVASPLDSAQVILLSGKQALAKLNTVSDLSRFQGAGLQSYFARPMEGEKVPKPLIDKVLHGDLLAHVDHARPGDLTVCAIAFGIDFVDPRARKRMQDRMSQLTLRCELISPDASVAVVAAPPQPRFD